ncbi:MAG: helix-turn-helix domain-containing protein [Lawsonibacter sp.]
MEIRLRLRELREAKGLSQRAVARSINVTPGAVAKWELGYTNPTMENILAMASLLNCSTDALLGWDVAGQTSA